MDGRESNEAGAAWEWPRQAEHPQGAQGSILSSVGPQPASTLLYPAAADTS